MIVSKIIIETGSETIEYYQVPLKLAKAIKTILDYAISGTSIVSAVSNSEDE